MISSTISNNYAQRNKKHIYVFGSWGWNLALPATCVSLWCTTYTKVRRQFIVNDSEIRLSDHVCSQTNEIIHFHCKNLYSSANKPNPKVLNADRKIQTRTHQHQETAGNKSVWHRKEGDAGINTWGRRWTDWEQVQHMRVISILGRRGQEASQRSSHLFQRHKIYFLCTGMKIPKVTFNTVYT